MANPIDENPRAPYTAPSLTAYGTVRELTQTSGGTAGRNDMGAGQDKTGF